MKTLWVYLHACIATVAWAFILLALCLALLDPSSSVNRDPVFAVIAILMAAGHLSCGSLLFRQIRRDIREARRQKPAEGDAGTKVRRARSSS